MKILLRPDQKVFFTSDTHYGHKNIVRGCTDWENERTRDFKTLEEMNNVLVDGINGTVGPDDILIHLGDWSFGPFSNIEEFRKSIGCKNVHLVLGNHDKYIRINKKNIRSVFTSVHSELHLSVVFQSKEDKGRMDKLSFMLYHHPIASWDAMSHGKPHLHGHTHLPKNKRMGEGRHLDVGVDGNNFLPISMEEVVFLLKDKPIKSLKLPEDHHER